MVRGERDRARQERRRRQPRVFARTGHECARREWCRHRQSRDRDTACHSKPTFHGDTIYAETRVLEKTETSKGDRGIVAVETKGINQRGEEVCYFKRKVMVWKKASVPPRKRPYDGQDLWT